MEISRARFLVLASALAASACTGKAKDDDPEGTGGQSSGGNGGSSGGGGSGGTEAGAGGSGGAAEAGPGDAGVPDSSVEPEGGPEGGSPDGGDAAACNDGTGEPGDCAAISSAESCGLHEFQVGNCDTASLFMKPAVGAKFVACIVGQSEEELCDATNTYTCKSDVLKGACPDPVVDDWCNDIVAQCPDEKIDECRTYLNGLNDVGRDNVVSCMESDCFGLYSCVESL